MMLLALSSYNAVLAAVIPPTEPNKLQPIVHNCINGLQKFIVDPTRLLSSYGNDTNNVHFKSYKIMFHPPNNYQSKLGNFFKYDIRTRTVTILKDGYARFNIVVSLNTRRVLNRSIQIMLKLVIGGEEKSITAMYLSPNFIIPLRIDTTIQVKNGEKVEVITNNNAIDKRSFYTSMEVTWL